MIENGVCISGSIFPFLLERNGVNDDSHIVPVSEEWNLIVVNHWNEIPEDYSVTLTELSNGQKVDSWIYPYLQEMFDAMRAEGIYAAASLPRPLAHRCISRGCQDPIWRDGKLPLPPRPR